MGMGEAEQREAIEEHLPLVRHIVFQVAVHFPRHVDREELARAGALGLVEAARRYDGSRGVPFQRFAAQRIRGAILDAVRAADWAPRSVRTLARTLESTAQQLASDLGRTPSPEEMAQAMETTPEQLQRLQERIHRSVVLALDHRVADDEDDGRPSVTPSSTPGTSSRRRSSSCASCTPTCGTRSASSPSGTAW
jgi:RNA polymerase sigma factor for flagellar operon FliA